MTIRICIRTTKPRCKTYSGPGTPTYVFLLHNATRVGRNPMLRADSLHVYVLTRSHAYMFTCLHDYMRTCLHALASMIARLYAFTCSQTPVLLHAYVLTVHMLTCDPKLGLLQRQNTRYRKVSLGGH